MTDLLIGQTLSFAGTPVTDGAGAARHSARGGVIVEGGRITESGSHQELIRQQGHYYSLYTKQFQAEAQHEIDQLFEAKPQPTAEVR